MEALKGIQHFLNSSQIYFEMGVDLKSVYESCVNKCGDQVCI